MPQFHGILRVERQRLFPVSGRPPSFVSPGYPEASLKITLLSGDRGKQEGTFVGIVKIGEELQSHLFIILCYNLIF